MAMLPAESGEDVFRSLPNFPSSVWGCSFASFPSTDSEFESYTQAVEMVKENAKEMLMQSTRNLTENIEFINLLCRLSLSYHFEVEIENQLNHIFITIQNFHEDSNYDLYTLSLLFQILKQYGYNMSSDVFKKFKNENGEFKEGISNDVKGLLSLYEATFLCFHGEDILDEALNFTKKHLEILAEKSSPNLAKHIKNALYLTFHHSMERIETLNYILFYEEEESRNETLLKFAKLDFNRLQLLYKKELAILSRWWKDLSICEKLPYARDRLVESYFWTLGSQFEPQYSFARLIGSKYVQLIAVVDDTFDSYGTSDELQRLTCAFQRCTIDAVDQLPNYMKLLYKTILNLFGETENDKNEWLRYKSSFAKEKFQELVRGYLIEAQWLLSDEYVPSFNEYVQNGLITSTLAILSAATMIGMEDLKIKDYEWMKSNSKLIDGAKLIGRLKNDIQPHGVEIEKKRGDCTLAVQSYMKEYGVSKEEAIRGIEKLCENAWKNINEEYCMKPTCVSRIVMKHFVNHARLEEFVYKKVDHYTYPSTLKDVIESLFIRQFPVVMDVPP